MPIRSEGYNYDIFISYRQKDNKYDGWVTDFVDNLKKELEATFKEDISVYFDINPHDGLLETHDVDESLKEKLKCLIFIPVISRTYCDPKSFAWEHEFKAFLEMASKDQLGLKLKLTNGNVASRILPIRIYDLDPSDIKLCESVMGGVLRGVEFIYKSAGVNRPLRSKEENPQENLNHTIYRDQINKVGNAVKDLITAIEQHDSHREVESSESSKQILARGKKNKTTLIAGLVLVTIISILGILFFPKLVKPKELPEKSIAVMPFELLSNEPDKQYLADAMMNEITLHLSKIKDLRVQGKVSTIQYQNPTKTTTTIGKELNVNYLLFGNFQKFGDSVRLIVHLIRVGKEGYLWAKEYDRPWNLSNVLSVQREVAQSVARELQAAITPEEKQLIEKIPTTNLNAYDYYQMGREEEEKYSFYDMIAASTDESYIVNNPSDRKNLDRAEKMYYKALEFDSTFAPAYTALAGIYWSKNYYRQYFSENFLDSVLILATKALSFDDKLTDAYYIRGKYYGERGDLKRAIEDFDRTIALNPNFWLAYYGKGTYNAYECNYVMAIQNLMKAATLNHGSGLLDIYRRICWIFNNVDLNDLAQKYNREAVKLEHDSAQYYFWSYMFEKNQQKKLDFLKKGYKTDPKNIQILGGLEEYYDSFNQYKDAIAFHTRSFDAIRETGGIIINNEHRIGYYYSKIGQRDSADHYFNKQIEYCNDAIRLGRGYGISNAFYDLAGVYAFKGDKIKAFEYLRIFNKAQKISRWIAKYLKTGDPLFDSIRNEPEFQKISKEVEEKSLGPQNELRKWLEDNNPL